MNHTRGFSRGETPSPGLRPWVQRLWYVEHPTRQGWELKLPSLGSQLLFNLDADCLGEWHPGGAATSAADGAAVATVTSRASLLNLRQQRRLAGVVLRPGAAPALLGVPADALRDPVIALQALWGNAARRLRQRCMEAAGPAEVLAVLDAALCDLSPWDRPIWDPSSALRLLATGRAVEDVADELGLSLATLRRRFRAAAGVSPKRAQRLARLETAIALLGGPGDLAEIAGRTGYCDQAHFTHDFTALTGITPGRYRAADRHEPFHIAV